MGGGGSPSNTTTTARQEPPSYVVPYLQQAATDSQSLYGKGPNTYYPGQTVTPFSNETEQALQGTAARATGGSPVTSAAQNYFTSTLNSPISSNFGNSSNPYASPVSTGGSVYNSSANPYLDATFNRAADQVQNRLQSGFAASGRNIDAASPLATQQFDDLANQIYGGAYENDQNRALQAGLQNQQLNTQAQLAGQQIGAGGYENAQNRALQDISGQRAQQAGILGAGTSLANQDYTDLGQLAAVGQQREDLTSRGIADQVSRYDYNQNAPGINLDQYIARLNNQPGGSSSATTPYFRNQGAGALGGASIGYGIGNSLSSSYGGGIGALLGGLLGAYG